MVILKTLVCTRSDENIKWQADITHPIIKDYCEKCGSDFLELSHLTDCKGDGKWHYRIMRVGELLNEYDRVLHIDTDALIMPNAPNVFDIVPYDSIGVCLEDKGSRQTYRMDTIKECQRGLKDIGWTRDYINTGFFLVSKCHKDIFSTFEGRYWNGFGYDDVLLGFNIKDKGHKILDLGFKWNHMTMFSEPWNGNPNRFESFIVHYAGAGVFDRDCSSKKQQMKKDFKTVYGKRG